MLYLPATKGYLRLSRSGAAITALLDGSVTGADVVAHVASRRPASVSASADHLVAGFLEELRAADALTVASDPIPRRSRLAVWSPSGATSPSCAASSPSCACPPPSSVASPGSSSPSWPRSVPSPPSPGCGPDQPSHPLGLRGVVVRPDRGHRRSDPARARPRHGVRGTRHPRARGRRRPVVLGHPDRLRRLHRRLPAAPALPSGGHRPRRSRRRRHGRGCHRSSPSRPRERWPPPPIWCSPFKSCSILSNLNPLLPTDGYHALEAGLGALNFRRRAFDYTTHRLFGRPLPSALAVVRRSPPGGLRRLLGGGRPLRDLHRGRRRHGPADPPHRWWALRYRLSRASGAGQDGRHRASVAGPAPTLRARRRTAPRGGPPPRRCAEPWA